MLVDGQAFNLAEQALPVNLPQRDDRVVTLRANQGNAKAVVFSGRPLHQPVFWQGPFALASKEALDDAIEAYQRGAFGTLEPR
ncbi:hypothetical protein FQZ97_1227920 [compost metagenome]